MNIDLSTKEEINLRLHQLGAYFAIKLREEPTNVNKELYEVCNALLDKFNTLQPQWIPISEKLPEEGVDVLTCFYTGERNYKMMVSRRSDYNYWSGVGRTGDMVAWMPLPKSYEPQEISEHNLKMWEEIYAEEKRREGGR